MHLSNMNTLQFTNMINFITMFIFLFVIVYQYIALKKQDKLIKELNTELQKPLDIYSILSNLEVRTISTPKVTKTTPTPTPKKKVAKKTIKKV